jgi:hypothetical protein
MSESKVAIVTVHGTGDTAEGLDGDKWFQRGSQFSQRLLQNLSAQGITGEIVPHLWSGANSAWDRERGANKLAARIRGGACAATPSAKSSTASPLSAHRFST